MSGAGDGRGERFWFDLGDAAVIPLVETPRLLIEPEEFFPDLAGDRTGWCFEPPWFDPAADRLVYAIQAFLVLAAGQVVLVDACVGDGKRRHRPQFDRQDSGWFDQFTGTGLTATDVSTVIFTHLHVDHVGWATAFRDGAWTPAFPRARHCLTRPELDFWTSAAGAAAMSRTGDYLADSVRPLDERDLLDVVAPETAINEQVRLVPAPGHTPGNVCVQVSGSTAELLILGDVVHHPLQLRDPDRSTRYCVDPRQAAVTRRDLLATAAAAGTAVVPAHFAAPSVGRVVPRDDGYGYEGAGALLRTGEYPPTRLTPTGHRHS